MVALQKILSDYDLDLLTIIANRWDVDLETRDAGVAAERLARFMLNEERAAHEWSRLSDRERGSLQFLLSAKELKMPLSQYARLFGDIRQMGSEKRQREKPHLSPTGIAEVLYYRGLIAVVYDKGAAGVQPFVIVPNDLAAVLPAHQTGYDLSAAGDDEDEELLSAAGEISLLSRADSAVVDDITTLLAYLQVQDVQRQGSTLPEDDRTALEDYLLKPAEPARIALMVALAAGLGLAADNEDGLFKPVPAAARKWLDQPRTTQMRSLIQTWAESSLFNELEHVPGLILERASWQNDPALIRQTIQQVLDAVPEDDWFSVVELVSVIKEQEPDFQRPAADYDSWYIRDTQTGEYIKGFENWDRVDGAVLHVTLTAPMHWLGLMDLGEGEHGAMVRLTAYGRAFTESSPYPDVPDQTTPLVAEDDGMIFAPRALSRYDRFQLARFTDWGLPGEPYEYHLSAESLKRAAQQGIQAGHILTFLKRTTQEAVPESMTRLLEQWEETGGAEIYLSREVVLQTDSEDVLDTILNTPELRRFLGARLGTRAVVVRADQWEDLIAELHKRGMMVERDL